MHARHTTTTPTKALKVNAVVRFHEDGTAFVTAPEFPETVIVRIKDPKALRQIKAALDARA